MTKAAEKAASTNEEVNTDNPEVKPVTSTDQWQTNEDEGYEGRFHKFEEAGEIVQGVYCGRGRNIGKGSDEAPTHLIMQENGAKLILVQHKLLEDLLTYKEGATEVQITFLGKKAGKNYMDYTVSHRKATTNRVKGTDYIGYEA